MYFTSCLAAFKSQIELDKYFRACNSLAPLQP